MDVKRRGGAAALAAAALLLAGVAGSGAADPAANGRTGAAEQPPVTISADEAEFFNAENRVVFAGKAVAVQGDATITADRIEVRLKPAATAGTDPAPAGGILAGGSSGSSVESMVATGNVTFRQLDPETGTERFATGERGEYDAVARVVTLSGGTPRAWEGKNVMNCERMIFSFEERNMKCVGKVNMTVYPAPGKEAPAAPGAAAPEGAPGAAPGAGEAPESP